MKRKISSFIIVSTLLFSVGCSSSKNEETKIDNSTITTESKFTEKEIYTKYEELLPEIKSVYDKYGLKGEEKDLVDNKYYKGPSEILHRIHEDIKPGDIYVAKYKLETKDDEADYIYSDLYMWVDPEEIASNGFKMEDTFFGDIIKVMCKEDINYNEINQDIVNAYANGEFLHKTYEYGDVNCTVVGDGEALSYLISMYE